MFRQISNLLMHQIEAIFIAYYKLSNLLMNIYCNINMLVIRLFNYFIFNFNFTYLLITIILQFCVCVCVFKREFIHYLIS